MDFPVDSPKSQTKKKVKRKSNTFDSPRGGPEGDSIIQKKVAKMQPRATSISPNPRAKRKSSSLGFTPKRLAGPVGEDSGLTDLDITTASRKKLRTLVPEKLKASNDMNQSWERAVQKARGQPDGARDAIETLGSEENIGGDSSVKKKKQFEKKKKFNVFQGAAKKLKKIKDGNKKSATKRKGDSLEEGDEKKKLKMEEMKKKELRKARRMLRNNYDLSTRAKTIWEEIRRQDLATERRHELCAELYILVKGKAKELIFAHDTCRVIQCLMKYGLNEHKNALFEELRDDILQMSKSKYAKFFVRKLLKYGTKAQRNYVFRCFTGHVRALIRHKEASEILELAYNDFANASERAALIEEFYGPSFALFRTPEMRSLDQIMKSNAERRDAILRNMKEALSVLVDKTTCQYSIAHKVFMDFFTYATDKFREEMIETVRESLIHMLHTRDGARVAMFCIWHGTAKDRKVVMKSMKTYVAKICREEYGHLVLLALFDVIDDTMLLKKIILDEMMKSDLDLGQDQYGRKVMLYLLSPRDPAFFHPDIVAVLKQGDSNKASKKEMELRRQELLEAVSGPLLRLVANHAKELVMGNHTLLLLQTIIKRAKGDPTEAMLSVAQIAAEPFEAGSLENFHIVEHTAGHLTLKHLINNDRERMANQQAELFSVLLMDTLPKGAMKSWAACNRGCFTLVSLLELEHPDVTKKVKKQLQPIRDSLKMLKFKGAQILYGKL